MRRIVVIISLALVCAACGTGLVDGSATDSTTTTTTSVASSSTTVATTTTTADPCAGEPFSIDEGGSTRLLPGCRYRTEEFVPFALEFVVAEDGWLGFDTDDPRLVFLGIDTDGDGGADADVAFIVWTPEGVTAEQRTVETLLAGFEAIDGVALASPLEATTVAGFAASTVDVEAGEDPFATGFRPCSTSGLDFSSDEPGFQLITVAGTGKGDVGFPACGLTRVWIVETADQPFVILAAPSNRDRFEDLMPMIEDFLERGVSIGDRDG